MELSGDLVPTVVQAEVRPADAQWRYFFWVGVPTVSIAASFLTRQSSPAATFLLAMAVAASALSGMALYRVLWPLCSPEPPELPKMSGGQTLAALKREKTLVLRSIKELEFDRNMGKVSEADFDVMSTRLRVRATRLIRELDASPDDYRRLIEKELDQRLAKATVATTTTTTTPKAPVTPAQHQEPETIEPIVAPAASQDKTPGAERPRTCAECDTSNDRDARFCKQCGRVLEPRCDRCDTANDTDARFCKQCGTPLASRESE